jgi:hypothetical protein
MGTNLWLALLAWRRPVRSRQDRFSFMTLHIPPGAVTLRP